MVAKGSGSSCGWTVAASIFEGSYRVQGYTDYWKSLPSLTLFNPYQNEKQGLTLANRRASNRLTPVGSGLYRPHPIEEEDSHVRTTRYSRR